MPRSITPQSGSGPSLSSPAPGAESRLLLPGVAGRSLFVCLGLLLCACVGQDQAAVTPVPEDAKVRDLYIVDCLLPGQLRQLGNTTYMTPRRPIRTTAMDCRVRGGEYVAYDRADYKTALKIWLPAAEEGDAAAQNTVGEIFEQGLGSQPNYEVAALWYGKAAAQGHKGAQFNLGTLYETGHGVPQDRLKALNMYRLAWGISDDSLTYRSESEQALLAQAEANLQLKAQLSSAQNAAQLARVEANAARAEAGAARAGSEEAVLNYEKAQAQLTAIRQPLKKAEEVTVDGRNYGRYYALMIGNGEYQYLGDLNTSVADVARIGRVLEQQYGFEVTTVTNGDDVSVLRALNQLNDVLEEEDNLFIYYAGHGNTRKSGAIEVGYWLPVNAEPPPNDTFWVPTEQVSGHLGRLKAKRIMVVADSAYAGLLADNPAFLLVSEPAQLRSKAYVDLRFPNRSRLLMTSGNDFPLPRTGVTGTSVFADALLATLSANDTVLTAPALFLDVLNALESRQPDLTPEFKAIKRAGDEVGDFFFVAR